MKHEKIAIPEYHFECEFCIMELGKSYCSAYSDKMIQIENAELEIDLQKCPIWGKINERKRTN